jgi:hypothetical protein
VKTESSILYIYIFFFSFWCLHTYSPSNWFAEAQTRKQTDRRSTDSQRTNSMYYTTWSANCFAEAQTRQGTDRRSTDSTANWFPKPHNLVRELICGSSDLSANCFVAPHKLITELIRWSTDSSSNYCAKAQTREGTHRRSADSSANRFGDAHTRQRTDSLLLITSSRN